MDKNCICEVEIVDESGYEAALRGLSYNKKQEKNMTAVAMKLAGEDYGHNKFLESIYIWLEVKAPRYWWQEADTYRLSTKQSESTMHTLVKEISNRIDLDAFEPESICPRQLQIMNNALKLEDPEEKLCAIKRLLPEGFLQKRIWCMSYKTLRNIVIQRKYHRSPHWKMFLTQVYDQIKHIGLLPVIPKYKMYDE